MIGVLRGKYVDDLKSSEKKIGYYTGLSDTEFASGHIAKKILLSYKETLLVGN